MSDSQQPPDGTLFRTISNDDWKNALAMGRSTRNDVSDQIRAAMAKRAQDHSAGADLFGRVLTESARRELAQLLEAKVAEAARRANDGGPEVTVEVGELVRSGQTRDTATHSLTVAVEDGRPIFGHKVTLFREHPWGETAADNEPHFLAAAGNPMEAIESVAAAYLGWRSSQENTVLSEVERQAMAHLTAKGLLPKDANIHSTSVPDVRAVEAPTPSPWPSYFKASRPFDESLGSLTELFAYRDERIAAERRAMKEQIGLSDEQVDRLKGLLDRDASTTSFERTLSQEQKQRFEAFFEGPLNQKGGPLDGWIVQAGRDPRSVVGITDPKELAEVVVSELGKVSYTPTFEASDAFVYPAAALLRLREIGGAWSDVSAAVVDKLKRMRAGNDAAELYEAYGRSIIGFADKHGLRLPMERSAEHSSSTDLASDRAVSRLGDRGTPSTDQNSGKWEETLGGNPVDVIQLAKSWRARWVEKTSAQERSSISAEIASAFRTMPGGDLTRLPLKVAVSEYVSGKGHLATLENRAKAHTQALSRRPVLTITRSAGRGIER